jgi:hypothetical protein
MRSAGTAFIVKLTDPASHEAAVTVGAFDVPAENSEISGLPGCVDVLAGSLKTATVAPVMATPAVDRMVLSYLA